MGMVAAWLLPGWVAAAAPPANLDVHNTRFVYSNDEKLGGFNLTSYLGQHAPWLQPYRELITHWSGYSTVSPRITLALIELETGLVSTSTPSSGDLRRPFGNLSSSNTFGGQAEDVLRRLSRSFYSDPGLVRQPNAARRALVTVLGSEARLSEFHRSFQRIFPSEGPLSRGRNSFTDPKSTLPPAALFQLPFPVGDSWVSNGAHTNHGRDPGPKSSIDFSRSWTSWGTNTSNAWVVAASSGTVVVHSRCFVEVIGAGGWSTSYYHLQNVVVSSGSFIRKDQRIANYASSQRQALCRGDASGPHVHFSLLRKGEYVPLHNTLLSAYRVDVGRSSYDSDCNHFFLERNGVRHCAGTPLANQSGQQPPPPEAPSDLQAEAVSNRVIELTWTDSASSESGFEIERRQGGSFERIAQVGANTTSFQALALESGAAYDFRVQAVNSSGRSGYSNTATAMTLGERSPAGLAAIALSQDSIQLTWTDRAVTETGYEVEGHAPGDTFSLMRSLPSDTQSAIIVGLNPQTTYTFRVRADGPKGLSTFSTEVSATTFSEAPGPCEASDTAMCLNQERFRVEIDWRGFDGQQGDARRVAQGTNDSGLFWFFQDQNWEMLVKVLDGCDANDRFWVFAAATTNLEYTLRITDTATGVVKTYFNPLGDSAAAITDSQAFSTCTANHPQGVETAEVGVPASEKDAVVNAPPAIPSQLKVGDTSPCLDGPSRLCLNQGRFELTVSWEDFRGAAGAGQTAPLRSDDSGLFWFFDGNNWEMLAKVLDGCTVNGHYWVFAASTTNLGYSLSVRDTQTGTVREYSNPLGRSADAITDTEALAVCP